MRKVALLAISVITLIALFSIQGTYAYHNSDYGFSITPPTGWSPTDLEGIVVAYVDPDAVTTGASINVVTEETRGTLTAYVTGSKSSLSSTLDDFNILSEGAMVVNGLDCYSIISTYNYEGTPIKLQQLVFVENGRAFIISFGAYPTKFDTVYNSLMASAQSFQIDGVSTTPGSALPSTTQSPQIAGNSDLVVIVAIIAVVLIAIVAITVVLISQRKKHDAANVNAINTLSTNPAPTTNSYASTNAPKFCRYCGATTKSDSVFCNNCGKQID